MNEKLLDSLESFIKENKLPRKKLGIKINDGGESIIGVYRHGRAGIINNMIVGYFGYLGGNSPDAKDDFEALERKGKIKIDLNIGDTLVISLL